MQVIQSYKPWNLKGLEKEHVCSDSEAINEPRFEEDIKEGEADHKGDSNVEDGQDGCKDDASDLGIGLSCLLEAYKRKLMFLSLINLFN